MEPVKWNLHPTMRRTIFSSLLNIKFVIMIKCLAHWIAHPTCTHSLVPRELFPKHETLSCENFWMNKASKTTILCIESRDEKSVAATDLYARYDMHLLNVDWHKWKVFVLFVDSGDSEFRVCWLHFFVCSSRNSGWRKVKILQRICASGWTRTRKKMRRRSRKSLLKNSNKFVEVKLLEKTNEVS